MLKICYTCLPQLENHSLRKRVSQKSFTLPAHVPGHISVGSSILQTARLPSFLNIRTMQFHPVSTCVSFATETRPHWLLFQFHLQVIISKIPHHLYTALLFTWTDYKTIFIPIVSSDVLWAVCFPTLIESAFACAAGPVHSFCNLLQTWVWIWVHLLLCNIRLDVFSCMSKPILIWFISATKHAARTKMP